MLGSRLRVVGLRSRASIQGLLEAHGAGRHAMRIDLPAMNAFSHQQAHRAPGVDLRQALMESISLLQRGQYADAIREGLRLAEANPEADQVAVLLSEAHNLSRDFPAALDWIDRAIELNPDPQHKLKKVWLLARAHCGAETWALMDELSLAAERDARLLWQLGKFYFNHNRLPDAVRHYERALAVAGEEIPAWRYDLAIARFYSGDAAGAERDLDALLAVTPHSGAVLYLRSTLRKQTPGDNHVDRLENLLQGGFHREEDEVGALYALAKEREDLADHDGAFAALAAGARKRRGLIDYDVSRVAAGLREIRAVMDADAIAKSHPGHDEAGAIFILGMPRTGTTLTERILLQSGKVANAGELMEFGAKLSRAMQRVREQHPSLSETQAALRIDFEALGKEYMQAARLKAGDSPLFIDKLPANFLYCGMIRKALPNARIIHLVRDPLDTCYAIYKTLFFKAYDFSYDLEELAQYYVEYRRLMQHWHEVMPGAILDVCYEDLVRDTDAQGRRLYDWCGLEWTSKALEVPESGVFATASAAQVREPVHTRSVNSSRRHLEKLRPLVRILEDAGILDANGNPVV